MKTDLDRLMKERNIDAAIIEGPDGSDGSNPAFSYLTGGQHMVGTVIIKRGEKPKLLYRSMEKDAADATGHELVNLNRWPLRELLQEYPDPLDAKVALYERIMADLELSGNIAFYGTGSIGAHYSLLTKLQSKLNGINLIGEFNRDIFELARETKDSDEISILKAIGEKTCDVIESAIEFLKSHPIKDGNLAKSDGSPLTIGDTKRFISIEVSRQGLNLAGDFIFAIGRDGGVPHSQGTLSDPIAVGKPIVFDIFPRGEAGYFHDVTRTLCLGQPSDEIREAYELVLKCFHHVADQFKVGETTQKYQQMTCDFFEEHGHSTQRSNPNNTEGYIHSLGHGLGLEVHEEPYFPTFGQSPTTLQPGMVFTVEPGLYYPTRGYGIRVEDTYYCDAEGEFHSLTPYPQDMIIPVE